MSLKKLTVWLGIDWLLVHEPGFPGQPVGSAQLPQYVEQYCNCANADFIIPLRFELSYVVAQSGYSSIFVKRQHGTTSVEMKIANEVIKCRPDIRGMLRQQTRQAEGSQATMLTNQ